MVADNKHSRRVRYEERDMMSVLVNLYGSQDQFLVEYQNMLALKILGQKDLNIDDETKNVELLKKRLGELAL